MSAASHTSIAASDCTMTPEVNGVPFSALMTLAISSLRAAKASLIRVTTAIRSASGALAHTPDAKDVRAAATARSTSAREACGTRPMTCSVCGETTSIVSRPAGSAHSPPM